MEIPKLSSQPRLCDEGLPFGLGARGHGIHHQRSTVQPREAQDVLASSVGRIPNTNLEHMGDGKKKYIYMDMDMDLMDLVLFSVW